MDTRLKGHFLPLGFSFTTNQRSNPNVRYFCLIPYISDLGVANSRGSCFPESIKPLPLNISPVWVIKAARTPKTCTSIGLRPHLSLDELLKDKSSGRGAEKRVWKRKMRPLMELGHFRRLLHKAYNGVWRFSNFFSGYLLVKTARSPCASTQGCAEASRRIPWARGTILQAQPWKCH